VCVPELIVHFSSQSWPVLIVSVCQLGLASEHKVADPNLHIFYTSAAGDHLNRWGRTESDLHQCLLLREGNMCYINMHIIVVYFLAYFLCFGKNNIKGGL
jgi:hypothetical protein